MFLLIVLDGVVPLVPGEASLLAHAPGAMAAGWPAVVGLAVLAATAAFLGDAVTYGLGRRVGTTRFAWQRQPRVARVLARTGDALKSRGTGLIMTARLLPGWRVAVIFTAGATRMPWPRYLVASALGVTLWATYLIIVGTTVGALTGGNAIVVALISMVVVTLISQATRWLRRRLAASRGPKPGIRPAHAGRIQYTISGWPTHLTFVN